jgi:hypothetical protein
MKARKESSIKTSDGKLAMLNSDIRNHVETSMVAFSEISGPKRVSIHSTV